MAQNSYLGHIQITALSFAPSAIAVGESTQMTITLKNTSGRALSGLSATLNAFYRTAAVDALGRNYGAFFRSEALNIDPRYGGFGGVSWANNATMTITQTLTFVPDDETYGAIDDSGRLVLTAESDGRTVGYLVNPSTGQYDDALIGSAVGLNIQWHSSYGNDVFLDISGGYSGDLVLLSHRWSPAVSLSIQRGLANGTASDEGERLLLTAQLWKTSYADVSSMACRLYYASGAVPTTASSYVDLTSSISALLAGVTNNVSLVTQIFSNGVDWYFMLWFGDAYEGASAAASASRAFANIHLSGASTGGVAFGRFSSSSEGNPKLESEFPFFAYGGIATDCYEPGDSFEIGATNLIMQGIISSSTTTIWFTLYTDKSLKNITSIRCTKLHGAIRSSSGYINSYSTNAGVLNYAATSGYTVTANKVSNYAVCIVLKKSSAFTNVSNNTPVAFMCNQGITLAFS